MNFDLPTALVAVVVFGYAGWRLYGWGLGRPLPLPWTPLRLWRYVAGVATLCGLIFGCGVVHMAGPLPVLRGIWTLGLDVQRGTLIREYGDISDHVAAMMSLSVLVLLAGLLLARALSRIGRQPTVEQATAVAFSWRDVIPGILGVILLVPAGFTLKVSLVVVGVLAVLVSVAFFLRLLLAQTSPVDAPQVANDSYSRDRQRVLQLLEEGKINGTESAALLCALAEGTRGEQANEPLAAGRKQMLFGALVVLVGFFLPWFNVDLAAEMNRIMPSSVQLGPQFGGATMSMPQFGGSSGRAISIHAGDIAHGLGWWVLILALVAAGLPFLMPAMPRQTQRAVTFVSVIGMSIIELYLLTGSLGSAVWGIWIALVGTAILWAGTFREFASPRLTPAVLA